MLINRAAVRGGLGRHTGDTPVKTPTSVTLPPTGAPAGLDASLGWPRRLGSVAATLIAPPSVSIYRANRTPRPLPNPVPQAPPPGVDKRIRGWPYGFPPKQRCRFRIRWPRVAVCRRKTVRPRCPSINTSLSSTCSSVRGCPARPRPEVAIEGVFSFSSSVLGPGVSAAPTSA